MPVSPDLLALSARLGADPLLIQGAGGNTSIKDSNVLWVKASGTELANADWQAIFVAVDRERALAEIDGDGDGSCRAALVDPDGALRPSVETTFHAFIPQSVVVHVHSVNTICHATGSQGRSAMRDKLEGLDWVEVPYIMPGVPLTRAIRERSGDRAPSVFVLDNHGLIVAAETVADAEILLNDVERRLAMSPCVDTPSRNSAIEPGDGWSLVPALAALAFDSATLARAQRGTYYPDHVVFLGSGLPVISADAYPAYRASDPAFPAVIVEGEGVFLRNDASAVQRALLQCFFDVLSRIPPEWELEVIGPDAEAALVGWDAEVYRRALAEGQKGRPG